MGAGDWNDGMNRVGEGGQGESVWLAWFLHATLTAFATLADARGDAIRAGAWRAHAAALGQALERRSVGRRLVSPRLVRRRHRARLGDERRMPHRLDRAVLGGDLRRRGSSSARPSAMAAVERELIDEDDGLALLFTPPFDQTPHDPGYIKGYPPGIRENGGQYTHAAAWSVIAFAAARRGRPRRPSCSAQLNPINHARTRAELRRYKVEPYVVAADIYAAPDHVGHGGWTWYTGSAGWMHRAGLESILGLRFEGSSLHLDPCIPNSWPGFEIRLRRRSRPPAHQGRKSERGNAWRRDGPDGWGDANRVL